MIKKIKNDNKGITLIELIVVVAIMMVLLSVAVMSFSAISKRKVSNAASSAKSMVQLAQTYARNKGMCKLTIEATGSNSSEMYIWTSDYYNKGDSTKWKYGNGPEAINENISVTVDFFDSSDNQIYPVEMSNGAKVEILFDRKTGGFLNESKAVTSGKDSEGNTVEVVYEGYPVDIVFSNKTDKEVKLILSKNTGLVTYSSN